MIIKVRKLCTIVVIVFSLSLVGCTDEKLDVKSPLVFYGEGETWTGTLYVEQAPNDYKNTFQVNQITNLTYKGDFEKINQKQIEEDGISVHSSFESPFGKSGGTSSHIQESTGWNNASSNIDKYVTKQQEFKVVVDWDNKQEIFIMTYNENKTSKAKRLDKEDARIYFYEPQK